MVARIAALLVLVAPVPGFACGDEITPTKAAQIFAEARAISERDGGRLWGQPQYGPMLLVQPITRLAAANQPDSNNVLHPAGEVWFGKMPADIPLANTAVEWGSKRWTMVLWPLPFDRDARTALLAHEMFHRIQPLLGFKTADPSNGHLDSLDGRYWLQLEWRALRRALLTEKQDRIRACRDALLFRAMRRNLFSEAAARERALEMNEGLAEYTGARLGIADQNARVSYVDSKLQQAASRPSFVRSFAYATGPAYGMLLDTIHPGWNRSIAVTDDLGSILAKEMRLCLPTSPKRESAVRAASYDGSLLRSAEETRERIRLERIAGYRALLVDGPVLELPLRAINFSFDPNAVIPLDKAGTVYPTLTASDSWGSIQASAGALISPDFKRLALPKPDPSGTKGEGWTVALKPGWKIVAGKRPGDYIARQE